MVQELVNQMKAATQERNSASSTKSKREQDKAGAEGDLASTTATKTEDEKFLADLTAECEQKTVDFENRQKTRGEELDAISKAIDIMSSDDVSGAGDKHLPGLVQEGATSLAQLRTTVQSPTQRAVASFLTDRAQLSGSRVLQLLAVKVSEDPFKKVTKMIKDMIFKLMEEASEAAEHQGFCNTELTTNKQTRDTKSEDADTLRAEMEGLSADIASLGESVAELNGAIAETDSG